MRIEVFIMSKSAAKNFAKLLKQYRIMNDLTQDEMAFRCGLSTRHYQNLEAGKVNPSLTTVIRIATVLDLDLNCLKVINEFNDEFENDDFDKSND